MLPAVTKKHEDRSTDKGFRFAFYCDVCGAKWESDGYPFSMRDAPSVNAGEKSARAMLWTAEHDAAYERANTEALLRFNKCHRCGHRVCDDCFSAIETVCIECEKTKNRTGGNDG